MNVFVRLACTLIMLAFAMGCAQTQDFWSSQTQDIWKSQTPKPATYDFSEQKKMQSAGHWDILAEDVAGQIRIMLEDRGYVTQPVYVQPPCGAPLGPCEVHFETPFGEGFYDLLLTHLVNQGLKVSAEEYGSLIVTNKLQVIWHNEDRRTRALKPGMLTKIAALASGWAWVIRDAVDHVGWDGGASAAVAGAAVTAAGIYDIASGTFAKGVPHSEVIITTSIRDFDRYLMRKSDIYYINDADYWHYKMAPPPQIVEIRGS